MDAIDAILSRRSIRKYRPDPIPAQLIDELLAAAMSAPSASNGQPWHFVIITERRILDDIPRVHPYSQMLNQAPLAIVVCGDLRVSGSEAWWVQDCSAATENLLLAAHAKGLGAVWLGVHPSKERVAGIQKLLRLPEHIVPLCIISMGFPAESKPPANRYDATKIHRNQW